MCRLIKQKPIDSSNKTSYVTSVRMKVTMAKAGAAHGDPAGTKAAQGKASELRQTSKVQIHKIARTVVRTSLH